MKPKVYIETTIVSYLIARPSRDVVVTGHQKTTQEWWQERRHNFEVCIAQPVVDEARAGDKEAAKERLVVLQSLPLLEVSADAIVLAKDLVKQGPLPEKAEVDALHIAVAVTNKMDYLLTWNCKHLANAVLRNKIEQVCRSRGYEPVTICTPEELMGV